jgi:hypothetical protein
MDEEWQLAYDVHYMIFGMAFLLLTGSSIYALIRGRNMPLSRINYAVNGVFVIFTASRALILLLHRYINEETHRSPLAFERFLFNVGFPCLVTAFTRICYLGLEHGVNHAQLAFDLVVVQCYLFVIAESLETTLPCDQHVVQNIISLLAVGSLMCGLCAMIAYGKISYDDTSDVCTQMEKSNVVSVDIVERPNCKTEGNDMEKTRSENRESTVTAVISCIGGSCAVMKLWVISGILKVWDGDMDMESWYSLMYANILRMIELGNSAMMLYLIHRRIMLKRKSFLL